MATTTPTKPRSTRRNRMDRAAELNEQDQAKPEPVTIEWVVMATAPKLTVGEKTYTCPHKQGHLVEAGRTACAAKLAHDAGVELPA